MMYILFFWFVLVWAVLAAVINPNRFLPYAAAAMTLFTTFTIKLIYYQNQYQRLIKNFDKIITERINLLVEQSVAKLKRMTKEKLEQLNLPVANESFHKELNQHFDQVFDSTSKAVIDTVQDGNITSLASVAKVASAALGGL